MTEFLHKSPHPAPRLIGGGAYSAPAGKHFPLHQHREWEIVYYRSGHIHCPLGKETYVSRPGLALLTPPATPHAEIALTAYSNYYLSLDVPADHPWPRQCYDDADGTLGMIFAAVVREASGPQSDSALLLELLLRQLDLLLQRAGRQQQMPAAESVVWEAERLMQERCAQAMRIKQIAEELHVSPSHLRAQFLRIRGRSPLSCLHALRLQRASALLRTSSLPLDAVASLCGYHSASHLSRHIKRAAGKPPGALRSV